MKNSTLNKSGRVALAAMLAGAMMVPAGAVTAFADTLNGMTPGTPGQQGGQTSTTVTGASISPVVTSDTSGVAGIEQVSADATVTFASSGVTTTDAEAVSINGSTVTIGKAGTYILTNLDPSVRVATKVIVDLSNATKGAVKLVLNGVNITANSDVSTAEDDDAVITVAKKNVTGTTVYLAAGSTNVIDTGSIASTVISDDDTYYPVGIICKKNDLTVDGSGALLLNSANGSGIKCTANVTLENGNVQVYAGGKNGISGKTGVTVNGGTYNIQAENDCLKATYDLSDLQDDDATGTYESYRAAGKEISGDVTVNGGTLTLSSHSGDGIQAYDTLAINEGAITVKGSVEGIEGAVVEVAGGNVRVAATDDGFNASGDVDVSEYFSLNFTGGTTTVLSSAGDGIDSNGYIRVSGGTLNVFSPANPGDGNTALDSESGVIVTGGALAASGPNPSSGAGSQTAVPNSSSTQCWTSVTFSSVQAAGTTVTVKDSSGNTCMSVSPENNFYNVILSSANFVAGSSYTVYEGSTQVGTFTASTSGSSTSSSSQGDGRPGGQGGTQPTPPSGGDSGTVTPPSSDESGTGTGGTDTGSVDTGTSGTGTDASGTEATSSQQTVTSSAKVVTSVTVNIKTVSASSVRKAIKKAGAKYSSITKITLGSKVKTVKKGAFKKLSKLKTVVVKSTKLTKKRVKGSLKGSKVKTIKVSVGSTSKNKKFVKKYKKIFTKANCGKKVKVR